MEEDTNISQDRLETIERYLKNEMLDNERTSFEKQLEENPVLHQQVQDVKLLFSGIKKAVLKNKLEAVHADMVKKKIPEKATSKVVKLKFKRLSIAASILILAGGFWLFNQPSKTEKLFNQYFEPDRGLATTMSETDNYAFEDAMVDYKNAKYDLAIQKWGTLLTSKPENDTLYYFLGVAELANKNEQKAIDYLKKVIASEKSTFSNEAHYYLGLAYLKVDKTEAAIENLQKNNSPKSNKIISELND